MCKSEPAALSDFDSSESWHEKQLVLRGRQMLIIAITTKRRTYNSEERRSSLRGKMFERLLLQTISFEDSIGAAKQHLQPLLLICNP
jgi:hypothetical protein